MIEPQKPEREVRDSIPTSAVLCPRVDTFTPLKVLILPWKRLLRFELAVKLFTAQGVKP